MVIKISSAKAKEIMDNVMPLYIVDVRPLYEYNEAHIKNAISIPFNEIRFLASTLLPNKRLPVLLYCRSGARSAQAAELLSDMHYENVFDFGGILSWPFDTE